MKESLDIKGVLPERPLEDTPVFLSESERHRLLVEWNRTAADYPQDKSIHELFETQVERSPEAVAVVFEGEKLTYRELNGRANQLAHHLRKLGIGPEKLVGLFVERSLEMTVALLGILKAGGVFVPLDPFYPKNRLADMLQDSRVSILITQKRLLKMCEDLVEMSLENRGDCPCEIICLDELEADLVFQNAENPNVLTIPSNLAYVIFTSGSTGKPKGVMVEHHSVVNHLVWRQKQFPVSDEDSFLQKTNLSFDIAIWEIFTPLLFGARLVLSKPGGQKDPAYLVRLMVDNKVSMAHFGPALLQMVVGETGFPECASLRLVFCGGEPLPSTLQKTFFAHTAAELISQYGPTETTVDVTWCQCARAGVRGNAPIGRPIANTQLYILNKSLEPVPIGVAGELHIGGAGLARGYLNRPELTAEKFIANPFSVEPGSRLYKTGDLARYLPDGNIEFLGRIDQQVKIRGFRIELGEIEAVLGGHPAVRENVVVAREDVPGEKTLAAYLVLREGMAPTVTELREHLLKQLPDYMVPAAFVELEQLPLTPNGKIDRKALPTPEENRLGSGMAYVAPRTPTEAALATIWVELLGLKQVGIHDNFFALGGHSLLAVRMTFRLRKELGRELPAELIVRFPTIAKLAGRLAAADLLQQSQLSSVTSVSLKNLATRLRAGNAVDSQENRIRPASFNQAQLWFIQQLEPTSVAYNSIDTIHFKGRLNLPALMASLNHLFHRQESLRTTFVATAGEPMQVIAPVAAVNCATVELSHLSEVEQAIEVNRITVEGTNQPFDLKRGPLARLQLLKLGERKHVLLLALHHIIWDGWSNEVLLRELAAGYAAYAAGHEPELAALPVQYADYAAWQRESLTPGCVEEHLAYWRKQLAGAPTILELPVDRPHSSIQRNQGAEQPFKLGAKMAAGLRQLGQQHDTTAFVVLLAAFQVLLQRYSRQEQILIGVPFAGRTISEVENLTGFFVNTLPVKADFNGNPDFTSLLKQVRDGVWGGQTHQELPFERLVQDLQPVREKNRNPIFQVLAVSEVFLSQPHWPADLTVEFKEAVSSEAMFDLTLAVTDGGNELACALRYNADLFDAATVERLVGNYQKLLAGILADPRQRVTEIQLLTGAERQQLLMDWNQTRTERPQNQCIHELFEAQVERTPEMVAVTCGNEQLLYRELNARANQLAHHLRKLGVTVDSLVGIHLGNSLEFVIAMLGTLKAGGAYMPLDPQLPAERIRFMAEDARVMVVISSADPMKIPLPDSFQIVHLNRQESLIAGASEADPSLVNRPEHLAYVLYTSGSTGRPKGVIMPHRALLNLIHWQIRHSICAVHDRTLQFASVGFDVCFQEIFSTLSSGGVVVIPVQEERKDFTRVMQLIERANINRLFLPFVALDNLAGLSWKSDLAPKSLREVITAGEQLRVTPAIREFFQHLNGARLVNQYGPTESHVVSAFELEITTEDWPFLPPIGRPIANTQLYILNKSLEPVPIGVAGELHIGGAGLARGYLNRPELTAEKFIANPFSVEPGSRLYKTGDLARYLPDGNIEFLGRIDQQVKIRGFRIELGEIEAVLGGHPAVRENVVVAREDVPGEKTLAAYLVLREGMAPTVTELREHLLKQLPDYMVPAAFVELEQLPLTPNGKIDRKALPTPEENRLGSGMAYVAPRTPTEAALATIWVELLGLKQVGIHDNFFALGGHSLLAVRMTFRIQDALKVELPVKMILECPTLAELGQAVEEIGKASVNQAPHRLMRLPRPDSELPAKFPVSFNQQQLWFIDQLEPGRSVYNIPLAIRLKGRLNREALQRSLNHLIQRHEVLRTTFQTEQGEPVQVVLPELTLALPVIELETLSETEREEEMGRHQLQAAGWLFDLSRGPLLRAELLSLEREHHVLLLTVHHIVFDGWSVDVLLRELAAGYAAYAAGREPELAALPVQYADYAAWQREYLTPERLEEHLGYWRKQLAGVPTTLNLPMDRPVAAIKHNQGAEHRFKLTEEKASALRQMGQQQEATLFVTLLAAFQVLLHRYARQEQILIGVPFAGRTGSEMEDMIGFFVNTLPVKADFAATPTFRALLRQVQAAIWAAQAHQDLPFSELVRELQPIREKHRNPLFQVCMLHEATSPTPSLPDLTAETKMTDLPEAKFDLTLAVTDSGNELACVLRYNADLFDAATIGRLADNFQTLLAGIVADPEACVADLPLLAAAERHRLLVEWNRTAADYPQDKTIHELFEAQVERTPDAIALVFGEQQLTYRELNERANQLAHHLRGLGVGVETLVGVLVDRSVEYVVSVLGILKAGSAYVPLDTGYPKDRLQFMFTDSAVRVVITNGAWPEGLDRRNLIWLDLAEACSRLQKCAGHNPNPISAAEHPAYVIYTSGSTGQPKGVVVPHRGVVRLVRGQTYAQFDRGSRFLLLASTSFDATIFELWGALLNGAVCVIFPGSLQNFEQLERVVRRHEITCLWLTAGLFNQIIDVRPSVLETVQHVLAGGEALSVTHVQKFFNLLPRLRLTNGYGPTESTTFACCHAIGKDVAFSTGTVPIGRPIANTQLYILNAQLEPVPIGVAGELHIGGAGLARGYLNRPELTAEKFIRHPFSDEPGARLYKTGDLCRYLPDGNIEYLGRIDQQVKIRGFRIELGEIEAVLGGHPAVRESVVVAREDVPGEKTLAAYLVVREGAAPTVTELREFLFKQLPDYMVPAAFVELAKLPLTPNGKIDRKALPAPAANRLGSGTAYVAPRTPTEAALATIWVELLGLKQVGIHDNFFALGGHSLLAVRMVSEINKFLDLSLSIPVFFQNPTIEGIMRTVETGDHRKPEPKLIPLKPGPPGRALFFLDASMGQCQLAQLLDVGIASFATIVPLPAFALQAAALNDENNLPSLEELAATHATLIQKHQPSDVCLLVGHSFGGVLAFEVAHQLQRQGRTVEMILLLDSWVMDPPWWRKLKVLSMARAWNSLQFRISHWWFQMRNSATNVSQTTEAALEVANQPIGDVPWEIIHRIYRQAWKKYRFRPLDSRAIVFCAQHSEMALFHAVSNKLGWAGLLTRGIEMVETPGDHFTLLKEPNLRVLAAHFKERVKQS